MMRMNEEQRADVIRLKKSGKGYKTIATLTGLNLNTVKSACRRSGLFEDNPEHAALFVIPAASHSTDIGTIKPLPPQRVVTGHKQTDAYLWVIEVIKTGEPSHIAAAEAALQKLTIKPKEAQDRYTDYLMAQGAGFTAAFATLGLDNPQGYINRAKEQHQKAAEVRAVFGSHQAAMALTPAEQAIELRYGQYYSYEWYRQAKAEGLDIYGIWDKRRVLVAGARDVLPEPHTLSDTVREFQYWERLYTLRYAASHEEYDESPPDNDMADDREEYLSQRLAEIKPRNKQEAIDVMNWLIGQQDRIEGDKRDAILLNLIN